VDYAVYDAQSRSIKQALIARSVGGGVERAQGHAVVVKALRNINLHLADGDRVGLVGGNGAGKSTLLKVLSGIYEPVSGFVEIQGTLSSLTDIMMGMDSEASGYENIVTRAVFLGLSFAQARALIPDVQEFSELGEYLSLPIRTYSSGMMTRLAFAVCTAIHPDILVMDEMIGTGDQKFFEKAERRMRDMVDKASIMVLASHSDKTIVDFCNKAVLMENGQVAMIGSPQEVLYRYHGGRLPQAQTASHSIASDHRA
jgi:ABC-2 type transport system ATP-binding protein/lipopolysaccharide transport system ATP-binding protein